MSGSVGERAAGARADPLRFWKRLALGSALVIVLSIPLYAVFDPRICTPHRRYQG